MVGTPTPFPRVPPWPFPASQVFQQQPLGQPNNWRNRELLGTAVLPVQQQLTIMQLFQQSRLQQAGGAHPAWDPVAAPQPVDKVSS